MKLLPYILGVIALMLVVVGLALHNQRGLVVGLPPRTICASLIDAKARADAYQKIHGGFVQAVSGTGSMAPYIPSAPAGSDPHSTVAYIVTSDRDFSSIQKGDLVIYSPSWHPSGPVIHQAAQRDADGWIMSGLHNPASEAYWRVTSANFAAIVAATFISL